MTGEWTKININVAVRVKLTNAGREHYIMQMRALNETIPNTAGHVRITPREDEDGWHRSQLWSLMRDFGSVIMMGSNPPFETEIEVCHDH